MIYACCWETSHLHSSSLFDLASPGQELLQPVFPGCKDVFALFSSVCQGAGRRLLVLSTPPRIL